MEINANEKRELKRMAKIMYRDGWRSQDYDKIKQAGFYYKSEVNFICDSLAEIDFKKHGFRIIEK